MRARGESHAGSDRRSHRETISARPPELDAILARINNNESAPAESSRDSYRDNRRDDDLDDLERELDLAHVRIGDLDNELLQAQRKLKMAMDEIAMRQKQQDDMKALLEKMEETSARSQERAAWAEEQMRAAGITPQPLNRETKEEAQAAAGAKPTEKATPAAKGAAERATDRAAKGSSFMERTRGWLSRAAAPKPAAPAPPAAPPPPAGTPPPPTAAAAPSAAAPAGYTPLSPRNSSIREEEAAREAAKEAVAAEAPRQRGGNNSSGSGSGNNSSGSGSGGGSGVSGTIQGTLEAHRLQLLDAALSQKVRMQKQLAAAAPDAAGGGGDGGGGDGDSAHARLLSVFLSARRAASAAEMRRDSSPTEAMIAQDMLLDMGLPAPPSSPSRELMLNEIRAHEQREERKKMLGDIRAKRGGSMDNISPTTPSSGKGSPPAPGQPPLAAPDEATRAASAGRSRLSGRIDLQPAI